MRHLVLGLIGSFALVGTALGQVEWNEKKLPQGVFREYSADFRTDVIEIPLEPRGELEYKLSVKRGESIVYQWDADIKDPKLLFSEFHGHTPPVKNAGDLMFYRKAAGATERGVLTAPFTGIHGWYLRNDSDQAVVVRLKVAGFYELVAE
jgi:hypothetical protein